MGCQSLEVLLYSLLMNECKIKIFTMALCLLLKILVKDYHYEHSGLHFDLSQQEIKYHLWRNSLCGMLSYEK